MMMRTIVLVLVVANALFFGWSQGWLDGVTGTHADGGREPQRLEQQLNAQKVRLLGSDAQAALQKTACLALGPYADAESLRLAQTSLVKAGVPANLIAPVQQAMPGIWAVATIKLTTPDFRARKEETYRKMHIDFELLKGRPDEDPTLILSRHDSEKAAQAALAALDARALKGLRVLPLQPAGTRTELVVDKADGLLQAKLRNLRDPALAAKVHGCAAASDAPESTTAGDAPAAPRPASGPAATAG
ncbi:hypothetical protein ACFJGW_07320 [Burkholderiaceae bacterium UC74_6]